MLEERSKNEIRECFLLLVIIMIGILIRMPANGFSNIDVTALNDPDSYYYARKALEFYNKPISEWDLFATRTDDRLMNAVYLESDYPAPILFSLIVSFICKVFPFLPIDTTIYYFSSVLVTLTAIPTFLFVRRHINAFGGLIAALEMVVAPSYYQHTLFGFFDTDSAIMLLAISYMLCHIEMLLEKDRKKQFVFACASFVLLIAFSLIWTTFYFYAFLAIILTFVVWIFFKPKVNPIILLADSTVTLVFCFLRSWDQLRSSLFDIIGVSSANSWPLASEYITELNKPKFFDAGINNIFSVWPIGVLNWLGGLPFFLAISISFAMIMCSVIKRLKGSELVYSDSEKQLAIIILCWTIITLFLLPSGIRYVQLLALPLGVAFGCAAGYCYQNWNDKILEGVKKDFVVLFVSIILTGSLACVNVYLGIVVSALFLLAAILKKSFKYRELLIVFLCAVFICPMASEYYRSKATERFIPDDVAEAANYIAENTPEDATIVSWWGRGYYYQYATDRLTVADGGIYNGAYFYWLGNIFMTEDDRLAKGICRMLQSGSLEAVKLADAKTGSNEETSNLLKDILVLDSDSAKKKLINDYDFLETEAENLIKYSHPIDNGDIYLVVDDHMLYNAEVIEYFGLWDFKNRYTPKVEYYSNDDLYVFDDEIQNTMLVRLYHDNIPNGFEKVFENDGALIFRIEGQE